MSKFIVNSISEYLKLIEQERLVNYIYRGQNEPYFSIQATGFRPYMGGWESDKFYDINAMQKEFYSKLIRRISSDEKEYFLAYCQHHGLPTSLVDFTYSPLIAMFFACDGKNIPSFTIEELIHCETFTSIEKLKDDESLQKMLIHNMVNSLSKNLFVPYSLIYLINKDRLIDITELLIKDKDMNFFERLFLDCDFEVMQFVFDKLKKILKTNNDYIKTWILNIIKLYEENNIDIYGEFTNKRSKLNLYKNKIMTSRVEDTLLDLYGYLFNEIENENITNNNIFYVSERDIECESVESLATRIYLALVINLVQRFIESSNKKLNLELDIYFTYQPPNLFDRISNQKGLFVYQPYYYYVDEIYNYGILNTQHIKPDITIEVNNYQLILEELNYLGINLESVYSDVDNISKSVIYNYRKLFNKADIKI